MLLLVHHSPLNNDESAVHKSRLCQKMKLHFSAGRRGISCGLLITTSCGKRIRKIKTSGFPTAVIKPQTSRRAYQNKRKSEVVEKNLQSVTGPVTNEGKHTNSEKRGKICNQ